MLLKKSIATQLKSANVATDILKYNFPCRIHIHYTCVHGKWNYSGQI
jgi:hypothetical protein